VSGFWPLVVLAGQQEQVGNRRLELLKINLGPIPAVPVSGDFAFAGTVMKLLSPGGKIQVDNITGGLEGDLLILLASPISDEVKIKTGTGNVELNEGDMKLTDFASITLLFDNGFWRELGRSK
jgi:hypothetical protein